MWSESKSGPGDDYDCVVDRVARDYENTLIRYFEGGTWLQAMVGDSGDMTASETEAMVACGVNLFGFDHLTPDDPRLEALIWSWAPGEPAGPGCAYQGTDGRFYSDDCQQPRAYACRDVSGGWRVSSGAGEWEDGETSCAAEGRTFEVPSTGRDNALLHETGGGGVWLNLVHL